MNCIYYGMETNDQDQYTTFLQKHGNVPKGNRTLLLMILK